MNNKLTFATLTLIVYHVAVAQINGEFWWLNNEFTKFSGVKVPAAKMEDLDHFANDENDIIIFRDNDLKHKPHEDIPVNVNKSNNIDKSEELSVYFDDITKSTHLVNKTIEKFNKHKKRNQTLDINKNVTSSAIELLNPAKPNGSHKIHNENYKTIQPIDDLSFSFPKENFWTKTVKPNIYHKSIDSPLQNKSGQVFKKNISESSKNALLVTDRRNLEIIEDVEFICNYITKEACILRKGFVNQDPVSQKTINGCGKKTNVVCCIIQFSDREKFTKIFFPENKSNEPSEVIKGRFVRSTRSEPPENLGQKQRETLLKKIFINVKPTILTNAFKKIVNPDYDYIDPYWNIKNSNLKKPVKVSRPMTNPYDYSYDTVESEESYASELPRPGLLGLYNGQPATEFSWRDPIFNSYVKTESHNQPTFDPRLDHRVSILSKKPISNRPISVSSKEEIYDSENQIVTYHANPDFQVLQDFKLLNLVRNKSRIYDRNSKKTTTERVSDYDSLESVSILPPTKPSYGGSSGVVYDDVDDLERDIYENCGQRTKDYDSDLDEDVEDTGTHPWLSLVVRTRRQHNSWCSATLVHPRAAITAASCVYGALPGKILLRAGVWHLGVRNEQSQQRMASVYAHPSYRPGALHNNLAILYWTRPLRMGSRVQPACLSDVKAGDSCSFVGWGERDHVIHSSPRTEQVTILRHRSCLDIVSEAGHLDNIPNDAFCVVSKSQGCVTGVGGSLFCRRRHDSHVTAVGVSVWRERCDRSYVLLLPAHEWTKRALIKLGII